MGFLDTIIQVVESTTAGGFVAGQIAGAVETLGEVEAGIPAAIPEITDPVSGIPLTAGGDPPPSTDPDLALAPVLAVGGRPAIDTTGFSGGNGNFATRTIVQTMNTLTGRIVKRKILAGSPHIMNSEIRAAKKVFRQAQKLHARLPRRTVRESKQTQLTKAAVDKAIRNVQQDCPPRIGPSC